MEGDGDQNGEQTELKHPRGSPHGGLDFQEAHTYELTPWTDLQTPPRQGCIRMGTLLIRNTRGMLSADERRARSQGVPKRRHNMGGCWGGGGNLNHGG